MRFIKSICYLILFLSITSTFAQNLSDPMKGANNLLKGKKYSEAIEAYKEILKDEPGNGMAWFYIGSAEYSLKNYDKSIDAYLKAAEKLKGPVVCYNLAGVYSLKGDKVNSIKWLNEAVEKGFNQYLAMASDADFDNIKNEKEFKTLFEKVKRLGDPCLARKEFKQFNFWVGKWDVVTPAGQPAGESEINLMNNGCTIVENWYGKSGFVGKSFNYFDTTDNKWHQFWINQNAQKILFEGGLEGKNMVFLSYDHVNDENNPFLRRLTFFNLGPDKVRQYSEKSTDKGKTWNTEYDLTYNRKISSK